jgi:hypothetical protein
VNFTLTKDEGTIPRRVERQFFNKDLEKIRAELDSFYDIMNSFSSLDPSEIFQSLAAFTARASYMRSQIMRLPENRMMTNFRTKELDPFIEECDRQFKFWSRYQSVQAYEWEITKGVS